jgi:hypothetical protein
VAGEKEDADPEQDRATDVKDDPPAGFTGGNLVWLPVDDDQVNRDQRQQTDDSRDP